MASESEDRILETLKKIGAHVDSAVGALSNFSRMAGPAQSEVGTACTPLYIITFL